MSGPFADRAGSHTPRFQTMTETARPTLADLLTIVIPTRDRPDYLALCLQSVFEHQETPPTVIVSDNSVAQSDTLHALRDRYPFTYIRQSGAVGAYDHHNACLKLPQTPWAMLLHDDDELYPNALASMPALLSSAEGAGIVVCGVEFIDEKGTPFRTWRPDAVGTFRGEAVVLRLGLDFWVSPPGYILNVAAFHRVGGWENANGVPADYTLVLRLAHSPGVALSQEVLGRYRIGQHQATDYRTPERAEAMLDMSITMARLTRTIGISTSAADRLLDYFTWWIFRMCADSLLNSHPFFVSRLCQKCELASPPGGVWRSRVQSDYPILFQRPRSLALLLFKARQFLPTQSPTRSLLRHVAQSLLAILAAMTALPRSAQQIVKALLPRSARRAARRAWIRARGLGARLCLGFGVEPLSGVWGFDRGLPLHRYYLQQFLTESRSDIRGHCLEFQDDSYTRRFGGDAVVELDILHVDGSNPSATIIADLTKPNDIPSDMFDCIICTHVLHVVPLLDTALAELYRILKPGGVLLATVPHISMCDPGWHELWRFTPEGLATVVAKAFGSDSVTVRAYGNSLTAAGELRGLVADEFRQATLDSHDPRFAVEVCVRAQKVARSV